MPLGSCSFLHVSSYHCSWTIDPCVDNLVCSVPSCHIHSIRPSKDFCQLLLLQHEWLLCSWHAPQSCRDCNNLWLSETATLDAIYNGDPTQREHACEAMVHHACVLAFACAGVRLRGCDVHALTQDASHVPDHEQRARSRRTMLWTTRSQRIRSPNSR